MKQSKPLKFVLGLLVLLIIIVVGLTAWFYVRKWNTPSGPEQFPVRNIELEQQYEKSLKEILAPFWQGEKAEGIRQQILDLRTPARYLDLHINLVLAFDLLEQGQRESDQAKVEAGLQRLNGLKSQYPWLAN